MNDYPITNKAAVRKNPALKASRKNARRTYNFKRAGIQPLKNRLPKIVKLPNAQTEAVYMLAAPKAVAAAETTAQELIEKAREAKLTGMSGNGFPVADKLEAFVNCGNPRRVLIVNAVECDGALIHDSWLLDTHFEEIRRAAELLKKAFGADKAIIAVKALKGEKAGLEDGDTAMFRVPARFPAGEEHFLVESVLGEKLPKSEPPVQHGILVTNVQTVWQLLRLAGGSYDGGRFMTVANLETGEAKPAYVSSETDIAELLQKAFGGGGLRSFSGHGLMASHAVEAGEKCGEQGFAAYVPAELNAGISNENTCKGCGACTRKCPMRIDVRKIVRLREKEPDADIAGLNADACIHCGSCSWFCHGNKIPTEYVNR